MKKYILAAAILLTGFISQAQKSGNNDSDDKKMKDYDEIVIKRKDNAKDGKVVIEIRDKQVIVDGKPIDEYSGDEFVIRKRSPNQYRLISPSTPFRFDGGGWSNDNDNDNNNDLFRGGEDKAFLGVLTEGSSGGARVVTVTENSAAEKAGLKKGDVITKINDKEVFDHEQLSEAIGSLKPDDKVTIMYKRDGKEEKTTATLGKRKREAYAFSLPRTPYGPPMQFDLDNGGIEGFLHNKPRLGIKAQDTEDGKGVKVVDVDKDSPADKAGIKENDVITSFEGEEVNSAEDLAKVSRESNNKSALKVQLKRNGKSQNLEIKVPKKLKTANI